MASIFDNPFGMTRYGSTMGDINDAFKRRQNEIADFSTRLASMREQYMNQIPQLNMQAFKQFGKDAAAQFGAAGMGTDSGAFSDALARFALPLQAGMVSTGYTSGVSNLNAENQARMAAYNVHAQSLASALSAPTSNPFGGALLGATIGLPGSILSKLGGAFGGQPKGGGSNYYPPGGGDEAMQGMIAAGGA